MNEIKFVQVPVEPTDEMLQAGWEEHEGSVEGMYAAMLSAAPKAPQQVLNTPQDAIGYVMENYAEFYAKHGQTVMTPEPESGRIPVYATPPQQEQSGEAVAWVDHDSMNCLRWKEGTMRGDLIQNRPLFFAPPTSTAIAAMVIKQAAKVVKCYASIRKQDQAVAEVMALLPANAEAELETLMMRVAELRDQESAKGYMDAAYQVSDAAIVRRVLDEKGE
jgi:hypothetical protein